MQKEGLTIENRENGIYDIKGDRFDMQLIVTSKLTKEKNFWLKNLTNDIKDPEMIREIIAEFRKHEKDKLYQSIMDMIVRANREMFKEDEDMMCDALRELYQEEINAAAERRVQEVAQQVTEQVTKDVTRQVTEDVTRQVTKDVTGQVTRQELCKSIQKLIKHLKITAEQAMDVLEIPLEERCLYV